MKRRSLCTNSDVRLQGIFHHCVVKPSSITKMRPKKHLGFINIHDLCCEFDRCKKEDRYEEPIQYAPPQTIDPNHDEQELREPTGETSYDVPLNDSSESDEDNLSIAKRRLFESVLKGKWKASENISKKRKIERVVKGREEKKDHTKKFRKSDKKP
uniref:Uncharacterized protein n=1 Tax=Cucumis melo TaxID=3656 RepID=A0A9I9E5F0_CUCME